MRSSTASAAAPPQRPTRLRSPHRRSTCRRQAALASAIGSVAPGCDQERHVEMAFRLADREAQWNLIEERRIGHRYLPFGKVFSDAEHQLIATDRPRPAADQ